MKDWYDSLLLYLVVPLVFGAALGQGYVNTLISARFRDCEACQEACHAECHKCCEELAAKVAVLEKKTRGGSCQ